MIQVDSKKGVIKIIPIHQSFQTASTYTIIQFIMELFDKGYNWIILDLSTASHLQSSLIGAILKLSQYFARQGGALAVVSPTNKHDFLIQLTRVDKFTGVYRSIEEARAHMQCAQSKPKLQCALVL